MQDALADICPDIIPVFRNPFFAQSEDDMDAPKCTLFMLSVRPIDQPMQALISSALMSANQKGNQ